MRPTFRMLTRFPHSHQAFCPLSYTWIPIFAGVYQFYEWRTINGWLATAFQQPTLIQYLRTNPSESCTFTSVLILFPNQRDQADVGQSCVR
mmetsp:Transcript_1315/g.4416  ORF Transcript_1315/g.4416 Transcript_1315/m.4416 type:complete len:91 (+) Transcript_1315:1057-1329(+)